MSFNVGCAFSGLRHAHCVMSPRALLRFDVIFVGYRHASSFCIMFLESLGHDVGSYSQIRSMEIIPKFHPRDQHDSCYDFLWLMNADV